MSDETYWPFEDDAVREDSLTALRIAVAGPWARWFYLVSFDPESAERPTEAEALMLKSFLDEYKVRWYRSSFIDKMEKRALDVDGGANGVTFHKYGTDDWGYNKRTWQYGPTFVPVSPQLRASDKWFCEDNKWKDGPKSLAQVMDKIYTFGNTDILTQWANWKACHPEVFGMVSSEL